MRGSIPPSKCIPTRYSSRRLQPVHHQNYHQTDRTPNQTYLKTDLPELKMSGKSTTSVPPDWWHWRPTRTQMATYLTNTGRGTRPVEDSAQKSAYLREGNEDTGGTTVDMNTSLASTLVGCSHKKRQWASSSTAVELQRKQGR